jgi:hypothetical protein
MNRLHLRAGSCDEGVERPVYVAGKHHQRSTVGGGGQRMHPGEVGMAMSPEHMMGQQQGFTAYRPPPGYSATLAGHSSSPLTNSPQKPAKAK